MQEHPSRVVNFVWAGSSGKPLGSYTMSHNSQSDWASFIPGNITSLFYNLPGGSGGQVSPFGTGPGLLLDGNTTNFWFEVTEDGRKTTFDQNGAGFLLGETSVLIAEGSCSMSTDDSRSLFLQIGVSRLLFGTAQVTELMPLFAGRERRQSFERQRRTPQ
jgi:hypothetical protein